MTNRNRKKKGWYVDIRLGSKFTKPTFFFLTLGEYTRTVDGSRCSASLSLSLSLYIYIYIYSQVTFSVHVPGFQRRGSHNAYTEIEWRCRG